VVLAQEEARLLGHGYIGTEHLLLGLVHEKEGVAARTLSAMNVSLEDLRTQVESIIGRGDRAPAGHVPFTPRAKKVLELSLREAQRLGHAYIGTEHLLLGLIREGEGVGAQVLTKQGLDLADVRDEVVRQLGGTSGGTPPLPETVGTHAYRLTDEAARVMDLARAAAAAENRADIDPADMASALLAADPEGLARTLEGLQKNLGALLDLARRLRSGGEGSGEGSAERSGPA
jgi:ATP-dependent Clp protease ATP-binding subunit ClpC